MSPARTAVAPLLALVLACGCIEPITVFSLSEVCAAGPTWRATQPNSQDHGRHTATRLPDGRVLVSGGDGNAGSAAQDELYNPSFGTWTPAAAMTQSRTMHTATLLADGTVLGAGGFTGLQPPDGEDPAVAGAEIYAPETDTWTATGSLQVARGWHTATLLTNGTVLVTGGLTVNGAGVDLASAEIYQPATGTWALTGSMMVPRRAHRAEALANGEVLVFGGASGGTALDSAEIYDPMSGAFTPATSMKLARLYFASAKLADGRVLAAGGGLTTDARAEVYDPALDSWTLVGALVAPRQSETLTALRDGLVLAVGGEAPASPAPLASAEIYDSSERSWTTTTRMLAPRSHHTATLLQDGEVLVVGGGGETGGAAISEVYGPCTGGARAGP